MEITAVKIRMSDGCGNLRATADITFDGEMTVKGIRVMNGKNGLFAAMPSRKGNDGKYHDYIYFDDNDAKKLVNESVVKAYERERDKNNPFLNNDPQRDGFTY